MWGRLDPEAVEYVSGATHRLMPFARALTGSVQDAEDLLQESLTRVLVKWSKVVAADEPDAYVRRLMVNTLMSGRRLRRASEVPVDHRGLVVAVAAGSQLEERDRLLRMLAPLPPKQRAAIVLRYLEDLPDAQVADLLGCSQASVRTLVSRGLQAVRRGDGVKSDVQPDVGPPAGARHRASVRPPGRLREVVRAG